MFLKTFCEFCVGQWGVVTYVEYMHNCEQCFCWDACPYLELLYPFKLLVGATDLWVEINFNHVRSSKHALICDIQIYLCFDHYLNEYLDFQVRGHQRVPSGSQEFIEITKKDAEQRLQLDLERLLEKASDFDRPKFKKEFDGFHRLFDRFLRESGPSIDWNKIEKLPSNAVSFTFYFEFSSL